MIALLRGTSPGETVARILVSLLVLSVIGALAYGLISGRFWSWRANVWKERAVEATGRAAIEATNAKSSQSAAENATATRDRIDTVVVEVRDRTNDRAERIEAYADPAAVGVPDADVVQDVSDAEAEYRAAANRLQRTRTR